MPRSLSGDVSQIMIINPREKWRKIKEKYPARVAAGLFMYGFIAWGIAPFVTHLPTDYVYPIHREILKQPPLDPIADFAQYSVVWYVMSKFEALAGVALGFAAGPKVVDVVRRPVDLVGQRVRIKVRGFLNEWST